MNELDAPITDNDYMKEIIEELIFKEKQIEQIQKTETNQEKIALLQKINDIVIEIIRFLQDCHNRGIIVDCSILNKINFKPITIKYLEQMMEEYRNIATTIKDAKELYIKRQYFVNKIPEILMPYINELFPYYAYCFLKFISDTNAIYINHKIDLEYFSGAKEMSIKDRIEIERIDALPYSLPPVFDPVTENPKTKTVVINGDRARAYVDMVSSRNLFCYVTPLEYTIPVVDVRKLPNWKSIVSDKKYGAIGFKDDAGIVIDVSAKKPVQGNVCYNISVYPNLMWKKLSKQFYTKYKERIRQLCKSNSNIENLENILMQYSNALRTMQVQINTECPKGETLSRNINFQLK